MIIEGYGVRLRSIGQDDLELMRKWRNDASLNQFLLNREYISEDDQRQWFSNLDKTNNLFFIIEIKNVSLGFIALKEIDWEAGTAVSNILIGDTEYSGTPYPVFASMLLTEFFFFIWNGKKIYSTTYKDNIKAVELDKRLGYQIEDEKDSLMITFTEPAMYIEKAANLRKVANKISNDRGSRMLKFEETDSKELCEIINNRLNLINDRCLYTHSLDSGSYEFKLDSF